MQDGQYLAGYVVQNVDLGQLLACGQNFRDRPLIQSDLYRCHTQCSNWLWTVSPTIHDYVAFHLQDEIAFLCCLCGYPGSGK